MEGTLVQKTNSKLTEQKVNSYDDAFRGKFTLTSATILKESEVNEMFEKSFGKACIIKQKGKVLTVWFSNKCYEEHCINKE